MREHRMTISLSETLNDKLEYHLTKLGISKAEFIRRSILTEIYLNEERFKGNKVLIERTDGTEPRIVEIVFA